MNDFIRFDFSGARKEFGDQKTLNYLRQDLDTNIDWEAYDELYKDNAQEGLNALQAANYQIYGKKPIQYNIHNQAKNNIEQSTPKELVEIKDKPSDITNALWSAYDVVSDILDVKDLVNPLLEATLDTRLPQNIFKIKNREEYERNLKNNTIYKLANNLELDTSEIDEAKKFLDNDSILDRLKDGSATQEANQLLIQGKTNQEISQYLAKMYQEKMDIFNKNNYDELTDNQKKIIDRDFSVADKAEHWFMNTSPQERLESYKEAKINETITKQTREALIFLENTDPNTDIFSLIAKLGDSKEDTKKKTQYLDRVNAIAMTAGFSGIATDEKHNIYFFKENQNGEKDFYKPNKDFFANFQSWISANAGSMSGAIYGFAKGAKSGNIAKTLGYTAVGAFGGGMLDYAIASAVANRENNFNDMLRHATQEGVLSLVTDVAGMGLTYAGAKAINALKNQNSNITKIKQIDKYYIPKYRNFNYEWLRVRNEENKCILTYKKKIINNCCKEYEVLIDNVNSFETILKCLDFQNKGIITKTREKIMYNDKYEFSFDNVDNMGNFVEIEVKKIAKDNESEIKELIELLKSLKIDINLIESKRYFDYL